MTMEILSDKLNDNIRVELSDLEVNMQFDKKEIIVECNTETMSTIRHEEGTVGDNIPYQIRLLHYQLERSSNHAIATYTDSEEVFLDNPKHTEYKNKLEAQTRW